VRRIQTLFDVTGIRLFTFLKGISVEIINIVKTLFIFSERVQ